MSGCASVLVAVMLRSTAREWLRQHADGRHAEEHRQGVAAPAC